MRKLNFTNFRPPASACLSALAGMVASLLLTQNSSAQSCSCAGGTLATGIQVSPAVAHLGDTVQISQIGISVGQIGTTGGCLVTNGIAYIMYPNGNSSCAFNTVYASCPTVGNGLNGVQIFENHLNITTPPPGNPFCAGPSSVQCIPSVIGDAGCVTFTTSYVVQSGDTNKQLIFTTPNPRPDGLSGGNGAFLLTAKPRAVQFGTAVDAFRLDNGQPVGGNGPALVNIVTPGIAVSKQCVTNCAPYSSPYGQPISFMGWVTNTGDTTLTNIVVTDNPSASIITFASTTTAGHPYPGGNGGTLPPGDSVQYMGNYQPTGNLCGPFQDTVTACGTDGLEVNSLSPGITNFVPKTVCATNSATCLVCTSAGISVTKLCPATNGIPGGVITFTGSVCNTGNVPLINVTVANSLPLVGGGNVVVSIPTLAPGQCQSFSGSEVVPSNVCSLTDTLTAAGTNQCTGVGVVNTATATCPVTCTPVLQVYKQVVCYAPAGCEAFDSNLNNQKSATGVSSGTDCPSFCYRITVTNMGNVTLSNLTVVDDSVPNPDLNLSGCGFPSTLAPGASASCIVPNVTHCTNTVNVVTASGVGQVSGGGTQTVTSKDTNNVVVPPLGITCTLLVSTNGGVSFFAPSVCATQVVGAPYIVRIAVTNTGQYALQNVVISNVAGLSTCLPSPRNVGSLDVGAGTVVDCQNSCTAQGTTTFTVSVCGEASQASGHICAFDSQGNLIKACTTCTTCVTCFGAPKICVTKEVACELPTGCGNYSDVATGAKTADNSQCPSFCYRVRVTNCGGEALNNVTVVDNVLNLTSCNFPTTLAVGQTVECIVTGVEHCQNVTNTVTASGVGAASGIGVSTNDTAAVVVLPISITCSTSVNGKPTETIPCDGQGHLITNAVEICNTGSLPLSDIAINAPDLVALGCTNVANLRLALLPGQCTNVELCIDLVTCPPACGIAFSNHILITATVDQTLTNVCSWTRNPSNQVVAVTATTECSATVECLPPPHTGCTPGFWKNCTIHWQLTGYSTGQSVGSVFGLGSCCTSLGGVSLLDALSFQGGSGVCGGAQILLRIGVGALLNAASPEVDYPFSAQEVIAMVSAALQSCDRATMITLASELDRDNNLGCNDANGNGLPCHRLSDLPRALPTKVMEDPRVAPTR